VHLADLIKRYDYFLGTPAVYAKPEYVNFCLGFGFRWLPPRQTIEVTERHDPYFYRTPLTVAYFLITTATVADGCALMYSEADFERLQSVLPWDKRLPVLRPRTRLGEVTDVP